MLASNQKSKFSQTLRLNNHCKSKIKMKRENDSHKGQNGKVLVVGGSAMFHGAPILCALGAENSGVDLIFPFIPPCHNEAAKARSLNFIIQNFEDNHLTSKDVKHILKASEKADVVVIGPGLGNNKDTKKAVKTLLSKLDKPTVIDASALIYTNSLPEVSVLTPHRGEFKALMGDDPTPENVQKWAKDLKTTIICKGPEDIIADEDELIINKSGNPLMTVGGSGDVLSGLIGGLMAQGHEPIAACQLASDTLGSAADYLAQMQSGLKAIELTEQIPRMLHKSE